MKITNFSVGTAAVIASIALVGCDWVDSTGKQAGAMPPPVTRILLDDFPIDGARAINEKTNGKFVLSRSLDSGVTQTFSWSEEPIEQGNLPVCASIPDFSPEFAADNLEEACEKGKVCELNFESDDAAEDDGFAEFTLEVPALDSPLGIRYALTVEDSSGFSSTSEYSFCLIAINDAPDAGADAYTLLEGDLLEVTSDMDDHLLSNDEDDTNTSNKALEILPDPLVAPEHAAQFELGTDGSFTYVPGISDSAGDVIDGFTYQVTDGIHTSEGVVSIRIAVNNRAPLQTADIPELELVEGEFFEIDFEEYFTEPDNSRMIFSLDALTPLVADTGLELEASGLLSGIPTTADLEEGNYEFVLIVSDGRRETEVDVTLAVAEEEPTVTTPTGTPEDEPVEPTEVEAVDPEAPEEQEQEESPETPVEDLPNRAPVYVSGSGVRRIVVIGEPIVPIAPVFKDADNDKLTYSMAGTAYGEVVLPLGVLIDEDTGIVSGTPTEGGFFNGLRVQATDPEGLSTVSTPFAITVQRSQ